MQMEFTRRHGLKLAALVGSGIIAGFSFAPLAQAQEDYPNRPVTIVVPFATGGYNDRLARAFAPYLEKELGQPLTILNQEGAGAQLGHTYALQQENDGYTVMLTSASPYIPLSILLQNAQYKLEDFTMINLPSRDYTLAATSSDSELTSMQDVIAKLKEIPPVCR
jgi:tripartite-type tricarboxylate transporter receptor subunit TctC